MKSPKATGFVLLQRAPTNEVPYSFPRVAVCPGCGHICSKTLKVFRFDWLCPTSLPWLSHLTPCPCLANQTWEPAMPLGFQAYIDEFEIQDDSLYILYQHDDGSSSSVETIIHTLSMCYFKVPLNPIFYFLF
jgi:hypothetical protein